MEADPAGVARFLSRHWLEDTISSAFRAAQGPKADDLDWVFDSLQSSLSIGASIERVYGYRLVEPGTTSVELEMNVASCRGPFIYTLTFQEEDEKWRVIASASDGTDNAKSWYEPTLQPVWRFGRIEARDRSRYFNESPLGEAFNLDVKYKPCPE
ncbi:hypothetical protein [Wenzhouxiangella sp. XN24]|uniref:hypothetical protein n=1 Tax=Wenzhouxiangella sp. XN24 TaxID=2713569 RepID=UPI0013EB77AB|nr:hypothetical protein [Wenzhouxiangella sp. XN24]NGX17736.1 hypothetical protein [Wenzhouxiangella sp. XN24]